MVVLCGLTVHLLRNNSCLMTTQVLARLDTGAGGADHMPECVTSTCGYTWPVTQFEWGRMFRLPVMGRQQSGSLTPSRKYLRRYRYSQFDLNWSRSQIFGRNLLLIFLFIFVCLIHGYGFARGQDTGTKRCLFACARTLQQDTNDLALDDLEILQVQKVPVFFKVAGSLVTTYRSQVS